ncbi:restriction endonuclease subunit S [Paraglaciecola aquimarina]|uniref:Restriction endonuclease subunit S n=1 Tax=Paraglaciecola aquimarina TaxID=1235557 RepID=A0ABU3SUV0_9ALTE|nr:restriction endonuclease subunit S [Paraglaciecola aquimarina]MDU0353767.1 restriction endonuclease subunit S [Paraglaciecola aquimarina]
MANKIRIGEVVNLSQGFAVNSKSKHLMSESGLPLLRITDLISGNYSQYLKEETAPEKCIASKDELIFTRTGQVGLVFRGKVGVVHNNCFKVIPNRDFIEPDYLYWFLKQPHIVKLANDIASGSVQKDLNHSAFKSIEIALLPLKQQRQNTKVLNRIEERIEQNKQTNQTLEEMAQALFKSWFVDFDPVIDNALAAGNAIPDQLQHRVEIRKKAHALQKQNPNIKPLHEATQRLFPSEFEHCCDNTLGIQGWIPKGWEYSELAEFIGVKHGYAYKGEYFCNEPTDDVLLTPGNVAIGGGFKGDKFKFYNGPVMDNYIFNEGDLFITMTDLSKAGDALGYPAIVPYVAGLTFHHNQRLGKVEFKDRIKFGTEFIYRCLCSREYRSSIVATATGTTVKHTSPTKILKHKVINSRGVIEPIFEFYIKNFTAKKELNNINSRHLAVTRDYLLPKLISGEVTI